MTQRAWFVTLLALALVPGVHAADHTVLGSSLVLKNPSGAEKRKVTIKAKESASDDTLVGDPTATGATVTIDAAGGSPSTQTFTLPVGISPTTGKPFWSGDAVRGFTYKDPKGDNGAVKQAQIKRSGGVFRVAIDVDGKLGAVDVTPPNPGTGACVLFSIGGGDSYSVRFADGRMTSRSNLLFQIAKPTGEGSCVPTTTTTSTSTSTTTTSTLPNLPDTVPPGAAPLRYRDAVFANVTKTADVVYGSALNASNQTVVLKLDVYEPTGDTVTARPAIVWVHGGSFSGGDKTSGELVDESNTFAMKGYLNVSINYRLEPGGCSAGAPTSACITAIQEAMADAQSAVRFLRANAATYGVDVDRIAIGGSSAGAITACNVGFKSSEDPTAAVAAVQSISGGNLLGPITAGDAPTLLFHGTADGIVPYSWSVNTRNSALNVGLDSFLTTWTGAGHVPYVQFRTQILDQTRNFFYWEMDLANAAQ